MLSDSFFDILILSLLYGWLLGWILVLIVIGLSKILPFYNKKFEVYGKQLFKIFVPVWKFILILLVTMFIIRLIAEWIDWV